MARSLSNVKFLAASVADGLSSIWRRGYAAGPHGAVSASFASRGGSRSTVVGEIEERTVIKEESSAASAWAPDPVTGYYRPANCAVEIDAAELREMMLNHKVKPH